tara:strand:- start:2277 stop:2465 length:189 start_codon:yes stop_codon:yes gene_type:complete
VERFKAFTVKDLQLLYNAVDFYMENRVNVYNGKEPIKESTEDVYDMKNRLSKLVLEKNFYSH